MNKEKPHTGYNNKLTEPARRLRREMTPQEKKLWYRYLRTHFVKWYKQRPIESFIVDFFCCKAKLIIEVDGSQHYNNQGLEYDRERTAILEKYSLKVIRFTNYEIDENFEKVCEAIDRIVKERLFEKDLYPDSDDFC